METGRPTSGVEVRGRLSADAGPERVWLTSAVPVTDARGVLGVGCVLQEITERKRAEQALEIADRRKDEFLATLAHELRNPLAPLRTAIEILRMAGEDVSLVSECREVMDRQVHHLSRLVDDLLEISRISQGKMQIRRTRVELSEIVQAAVESARAFLDEAGHELTVRIPRDPVGLDGDPIRLSQVVANLLSNAAKYTPNGGHVELFAELEGDTLRLSVRDDGIGIAPDQRDEIFEMFRQVDRSLESGFRGLGIGLTLVRALVELHGGTVEVRSEGLGKGSVFTVRLPAVAGRPSNGAPPSSDRAAGNVRRSGARHRVLVVDDRADTAHTLAKLLEIQGHDVRTAGDGEEALAQAADFRPQVVLLDIGLPKLNGYEVARRLRSSPEGARMVLAAVTGWGQEHDREKAWMAGFDHHLTKPTDPEALQRVLDSVEKRLSGPARAPVPAPSQSRPERAHAVAHEIRGMLNEIVVNLRLIELEAGERDEIRELARSALREGEALKDKLADLTLEPGPPLDAQGS